MNGVQHKWNTRRCIRFNRLRTRDKAEIAMRFMFRHWYSGQSMPAECPWCGGWHVVTSKASLAALPPLFVRLPADPARSNGSYARRGTSS